MGIYANPVWAASTEGHVRRVFRALFGNTATLHSP
jgi:hypothetical protein